MTKDTSLILLHIHIVIMSYIITNFTICEIIYLEHFGIMGVEC
jgi:hypothetical protein